LVILLPTGTVSQAILKVLRDRTEELVLADDAAVALAEVTP
ncbi:hypothetical protein LCGC14_2506640, partial [marine sediment metagenome]